jgi:hypothetical protein
MNAIVVERVAAPTIEVIAPGPYLAEIFPVVWVGPPGPAYYADGVSQAVASGNVNGGGWLLPPSLRAAMTLQRIHARVITGTGSYTLAVKRNSTTVYGPVTVAAGTPVTATVALSFSAGDAVVAEIADATGVQAYAVQLDGLYS